MWRFEDYDIETGLTSADRVPYAAIREFFALSALGRTHEEAVTTLRAKFAERIEHLQREGEPIPAPGSGPGRARFASDVRVQALRPFADEFWDSVLGAGLSASFVSDESRLASWEQYAGGRAGVIQRVRQRYGVDITAVYDAPIPEVLSFVRDRAA